MQSFESGDNCVIQDHVRERQRELNVKASTQVAADLRKAWSSPFPSLQEEALVAHLLTLSKHCFTEFDPGDAQSLLFSCWVSCLDTSALKLMQRRPLHFSHKI